MAQLLLVNPRSRKRRKKSPTTGARKRRRKNPVSAVRRKRRRNPIVTARANPIKRRRRKNPISGVRRKRRRNPIGGRKFSVNGIMRSTVMPAATGALGALGLDAIFGYVPLPAPFISGPQKHLTKGLMALAMGFVASKIVKRKTAEDMALGAMTVVLHDAARDMVTRFAPNVKLGYYMDSTPMNGIGYYPPEQVSQPALGYYPQSQDNAWMNQNAQMGEYSYN